MNPANDIRQLTIRAGYGTLAFTITEKDGEVMHYPYTVKSSMSLAANLRQAFREQPFLNVGEVDKEGKLLVKATLTVVTPVLLIPYERYTDRAEQEKDALYNDMVTGHKGETKITTMLESFNSVAMFSVDSDLLLVVTDHCSMVSVDNVMIPKWNEFYNRYFKSDGKRRLFACFHDKKVDIFSFAQHRIHFANSFEAVHAHDALYYILFVWKQLGFSQEHDTLIIDGQMEHHDWLMTRLKAYVREIETT